MGWLVQISKHLRHIEVRTMESQLLGHEVVRQMIQFWCAFVPPPHGDWGWMLRKALDISVRAQRSVLQRMHTLAGLSPWRGSG